jgi:hypothetical protein
VGFGDFNLNEIAFTWQLVDAEGKSTLRLAQTASGSSETYELATACGLTHRVHLTLLATADGNVEKYVRERHQFGD